MKELEIGEGKELIQFLHANAYTPGCYHQMFSYINNYKIALPFQRPLWKDSNPAQFKSWHQLADDIILHMDQKSRKNVIGMGHSMGGIATWLASLKRPDLFSQIILIDPVVLPLQWATMMHVFPMSIKKKYFPLIKRALKRRNEWKSLEEAKAYFLSKKVFQRFEEKAFNDFIDYGLVENENNLTLAYPREWEARVYATPSNMWSLLNKSTCPITILRAEYSDVISDDRWEKIKKNTAQGNFIQLEKCGHLVPFERPEFCAGEILKLLVA